MMEIIEARETERATQGERQEEGGGTYSCAAPRRRWRRPPTPVSASTASTRVEAVASTAAAGACRVAVQAGLVRALERYACGRSEPFP